MDAENTFGINAAYLAAHAVIETGGNINNITFNYQGTTVYNTYGAGAIDTKVAEGAGEFAFIRGWTTIDKAILGGAEFVRKYVDNEQNTVYEMRWHSADPGIGPQYATAYNWAYEIARGIYKICGSAYGNYAFHYPAYY